MAAAFRESEWPNYFRKIFDTLKPGSGWLQMFDLDRRDLGILYSHDDSIPKNAPSRKVFPGCPMILTRVLRIRPRLHVEDDPWILT